MATQEWMRKTREMKCKMDGEQHEMQRKRWKGEKSGRGIEPYHKGMISVLAEKRQCMKKYNIKERESEKL